MNLTTYHTVAEVLADVRAMRPLGGSAYGHSAAMGFRLIAEDRSIDSIQALYGACDQLYQNLLAEKPTMATIHNAQWLIVEKTRLSNETDLTRVRQAILKRSELFAQRSATALERLGEVGGNLIGDNNTVMMHSFSRSLMACFAAARNAGKSFDVICTQSQPSLESHHALRQLTSLGINVTFVLDSAMAVVLPEADLCFVGADSIHIDGSVANKVGTYQLALLAEAFGKPLYVPTEVMKLQRHTVDGHAIQLEQRPAREILDTRGFDQPDRIRVRHQFFDLTPARLIRSLITEQGIISPASIGAAWRQLEGLFSEVPGE